MGFKDFMGSILPPLLRHIPRDKPLLYPFYLAGQVNVRQEEVSLKRLPLPFDGLSISYASDIHFGDYLTRDQAFNLYHQLLSLGSDLIILGGDYGQNYQQSLQFFREIPSFPASVPVLAVLGNHDYGRKTDRMSVLLDAMKEKNVTPLVNEVWTMDKGDKMLAVCVPDDVKCGTPDFRPLTERARRADFVIFAPHSPDLIPEAYSLGFPFQLALCGHTHGGQIALFGHSLLASSRYGDRYRAGWYHENGAVIHVSSGVGTSILPVRLGTRAEIHQFTLRSEQ